jgi:hypothetical protein
MTANEPDDVSCSGIPNRSDDRLDISSGSAEREKVSRSDLTSFDETGMKDSMDGLSVSPRHAVRNRRFADVFWRNSKKRCKRGIHIFEKKAPLGQWAHNKKQISSIRPIQPIARFLRTNPWPLPDAGCFAGW